jgi:hypothetical protein
MREDKHLKYVSCSMMRIEFEMILESKHLESCDFLLAGSLFLKLQVNLFLVSSNHHNLNNT